jgi:ferredoxin
MKVHVDSAKCSGHGRCWALAPTVYEPDDDGFNEARDSIIDVPAGEESAALAGLRGCPEGALAIIE